MFLISGFLIGIVGSLHCATMCGPLVMAINYNQKSWSRNLLYHGGRVTTYILIGIFFGLLGEGFALVGWQKWLSIVLGLILAGVTFFPHLKGNTISGTWLTAILVPMKKRLLKAVNSNRIATLFMLGMLNGLLPCGMVYVAISTSLAASDLYHAAMIMAGFGIGTFPLLMTIALGSKFFTKTVAQYRYVIPVFTMIIASMLIIRGLELNIPYLSPVLNMIGGDAEITTCGTPK